MVIISYKVKQSVHHNPTKFILEFGTVMFSIIFDRFNAYEKIAIKNIFLTIVESNDIRKIIVLELLKIHFKNVVV